MSFSNQVKEEIAQIIVDRDRQYACLYGILLYSRTFTEEQIVLQSENNVFAEIVPRLFSSVFHFQPQKTAHTSSGVSFRITDAQQIQKICQMYQIKPEHREIRLGNLVNNSLGAFVAGVFFSCGSVSDPNKEYHLEFNTPSEMLSSDIGKVLGSIGVSGNSISRKDMYVYYIKGSEGIEDTLTFMGAQQCTIEIMNIKIHKDMRNRANRLRNCDEANINKTVNAAMRQIEDILKIERAGKLEDLPENLRELCELRLDHPEMSLTELGENLSTPIGRSGVNHRFQKIAKIAKDIKKA